MIPFTNYNEFDPTASARTATDLLPSDVRNGVRSGLTVFQKRIRSMRLIGRTPRLA